MSVNGPIESKLEAAAVEGAVGVVSADKGRDKGSLHSPDGLFASHCDLKGKG